MSVAISLQSSNPPAAARLAAPSGASARGSSTLPVQQVDYMKLIVAQMQNLNPMNPSSGSDSMPLLMQAETLNQLTQLNKALNTLEQMQQASDSSSLIWRTVQGADEASDGVRRVGSVACGP